MTLDWNDVVDLLSLASVYDQRTVGEEDVKGWMLVANRERWTPQAAQAVIVEHYSRGADRPRITPPAISDRIRALRGQAAESFELPRISDDLPDADYPAWLRWQLSAHCDAQLERWANTGEEPSRALPAAPAVVSDLTELVTRAPLQHRKAIATGVRAMDARRVRLDPERRAQAHAELDGRRPAEDVS